MKDFLGRELEIDQYVVVIQPGYRALKLAKIVGFTNLKVRLSWVNDNSTRYGTRNYDLLQDPTQVCLVGGEELTMYILSKT